MNITTNNSQILLALNKPKGYLVTRSDDLGRKTVYNLLPTWLFQDGWMPIGRLDLESKGLLLFTRDGKINDALTKPSNCIKIYEVWVRGYVTDEHISEAKKGVESKGYEVSLAGELTDKLDTTFSLAKFEAKDAKNEKVNTKQSRATANLFTNYKLNKDLDVGAGLKYYSKYYTGTGNSYIEQKDYLLANTMMKYKLDKNTSVQLNVNNLFDKKYYEGIGNYWMVYGEPRNFNVSVGVE